MPNLEKVETGYLYTETFTSPNLVWQFFPNDPKRYTIKDNKVLLKYGKSTIKMLTKTPEENFVMQCEISHTPLANDSFAGVVLFKDNDDWVECQSFLKSKDDKQFYNYIKVVRDGCKYTFYAAKYEDEWEMVGRIIYEDCNLIGFFLDSKTDNIRIKNIEFFKSNIITVRNLKTIDHVKIKTDFNLELCDIKAVDNKAEIDVTQMLLPLENCYIEMYNGSKLIKKEQYDFIHGGDVFGVKYNISVKLDDIELPINKEYDLGETYDGKEVMLIIENLEKDFIMHDLVLKIEKYSSFFLGHENVWIKKEDDKDFAKSIYIKNLDYNAPLKIVMKIDKNKNINQIFSTHGFKYKIILE